MFSKYFVYLFRQINFHQSLEGPTPANIKMFIYDLVLRADVYTLSTINQRQYNFLLIWNGSFDYYHAVKFDYAHVDSLWARQIYVLYSYLALSQWLTYGRKV